MASSLPSLCRLCPLCRRRKVLIKYPQIRSQSFKDEGGKSADIVDGSLKILREKIEEVKKKESLMSTDHRHKSGWNYQSSGYNYKHKRDAMAMAVLLESFEIMGFVSVALGFVFLFGSLFIFIVFLLVHVIKLIYKQ